MTEQTVTEVTEVDQSVETESTEVEPTQSAEEILALIPENVKPLAEISRTMWEDQVQVANTLAGKLHSAGNVNALIHEIRDVTETDDPTILEYREWKNAADLAILAAEEKVERHIREAGLVNVGDIDIPAVTEQYNGIAKSLKSLRTSLLNFITEDGLADKVVSSWTALKNIPGSRNSSHGTGKGAGVEKARLQEVTVNGNAVFDETTKDGVTTQNVTLTFLAQYLSKASGVTVTGPQIREAAYSAANVSKLAELNGKPVEFSFSAGDKNYMLKITPAVSK